MSRLEASGGYVDLNKSLKLGLPEVRVIPDRAKAAALGVDARSIGRTIQAMVGGMAIGTFKEGGDRFDIRVRLDAEDRNNPSSIEHLYVRGRDGDVVELRNLVEVVTGAGPSAITRTDRLRSVAIEANFDGKKLGAAMAETEAIAGDILPESFKLVWTGQAERMIEGQGDIGLAFVLALLVIYLVLAAQFESLVHPLTIMMALPLAMVGALGGLWLRGMSLNLFSLIGIILLMGLVTNNSILLIDYTNQLRERGYSKLEAVRTAAPVRMRPVLMTAFSMIFGVLPAALGVGPGAETRAPMGVAVAAGMFSSTLLTLLVVPVIYLLLDDGIEWLRDATRRWGQRLAPRAGPTASG
jgi:HAE1 family hydrophobic/amphiphilic exporter-1